MCHVLLRQKWSVWQLAVRVVGLRFAAFEDGLIPPEQVGVGLPRITPFSFKNYPFGGGFLA